MIRSENANYIEETYSDTYDGKNYYENLNNLDNILSIFPEYKNINSISKDDIKITNVGVIGLNYKKTEDTTSWVFYDPNKIADEDSIFLNNLEKDDTGNSIAKENYDKSNDIITQELIDLTTTDLILDNPVSVRRVRIENKKFIPDIIVKLADNNYLIRINADDVKDPSTGEKCTRENNYFKVSSPEIKEIYFDYKQYYVLRKWPSTDIIIKKYLVPDNQFTLSAERDDGTYEVI